MARIRILSRRNVDSLTRKILYRRMPTGIKIIGIPRELLSIVYRRKEKDQILINSKLTVGKKSGL